ncbi:Ig-like domain-containing protein [Leptospira idonii]|uniref:SbsA Ig-like domain-containing protein n=1 Tax=Leptospira idonii TaxID=1193500 RepID=A0A4R9M167_9LEPT|nr:Ig-like domain-containing protein [Leptospira idonii]TGN19792.1 hypothetical protein EHS15_07025 [Leptospira idonii]
MTFRKKIISIVLLSVFANCTKIPTDEDLMGLLGIQVTDGYTTPKVLFVNPGNDSRSVPTSSSIVIDFTKPMDKMAMESAVQLSAPGGNTSYTPSWVFDTRLILDFGEGLTKGKRYELTLNASASKDKDGNRLSKNFISSFYTEGAESTPSVVSSDPPPSDQIQLGWPLNKNLMVQFSEPMDPVTTNSAVGIEGATALYSPVWNSDFTVLTLQLKGPLTLGATYRLRVNPTAKSKLGIGIGKEYLVAFGTGSNLEVPTISADVVLGTPWTSLTPEPYLNTLNGVSKFDKFRFNFSTPMKTKNISGEIRFNPSIAGNFTWLSDRILEFSPSSLLESGRTYRLSIGRDFTSASGISLDQSYSVDFTVDDILTSTAIVPSQVNGRAYDSSCILGSAIDQTIPIPPNLNVAYPILPTYAVLCTIQYEMELLFNTAGASRLKISGDGSVFSAISIDYVSGPVASATIQQIDYIPTANPQRVRVKLSGLLAGARFLFKIKGGTSGLKDGNENTLANDLEFLFYGN